MASSSVLDKDEVTVIGVAKAPQPQPSSLINLFDTDDDDDEGAAYTASMMQSLQSQQKKKRKASSAAMAHHAAAKKPASSGVDAIEILDGTTNNNNGDSQENRNETTYRQALGPVRMDFVPSWRSSSTSVTGSNSHYGSAAPTMAAGVAAGTTSSAGQEHVFAHQAAAATQRSRVGSRNLYKELLEYQLNLPINWSSSIFCRAQEARTDLLRVLITGPEGTPYANGCFLFDLHLQNYPNQAPKVRFLTTGEGRVRFNPNLYQCGKVCLSLLGTWQGPGWQPGKSTVLQVLVSIQGLILVPDPYFNEPGYEKGRGTKHHDTASERYSANIRRFTLQHAVLDVLQQAAKTIQSQDGRNFFQYPEFRQVIVRHFAVKAEAVEEMLQEWTAKDASLNHLATQIRKHLAVVVQAYQDEQEQKKPAAAARRPPETIVIE